MTALEKPSYTNPGRLANQALDKLEEAAGGRTRLVEALIHAPETENQKRIVGLLADPRMDTTSLGKVCAAADLTVGEFLGMLKEGRHARALLEAMGRVEDLLPDVAEDLMQRAVPHLAPCTSCLGYGVVGEGAEEKKCGACRGSGKVPREPDLARQKVALEVGGLLKREPLVQVNQQAGIFARFGGEYRRDFRGRMDEVLNAPRGAKAVEVVDAEPAGGEDVDGEGEEA